MLTQLSIFVCLALATERALSGTFSVIVLPAAVKAFSPIVTGAIRFVLQPIKAPSLTIVLDLFLPS